MTLSLKNLLEKDSTRNASRRDDIVDWNSFTWKNSIWCTANFNEKQLMKLDAWLWWWRRRTMMTLWYVFGQVYVNVLLVSWRQEEAYKAKFTAAAAQEMRWARKQQPPPSKSTYLMWSIISCLFFSARKCGKRDFQKVWWLSSNHNKLPSLDTVVNTYILTWVGPGVHIES